jgi:uncharacterized protein (TIGR00290 family)
MPKATLVSWSSGKDSAYALHVLQQSPRFDIRGVFATVNPVFRRISMHAVREELLALQTEALGLPLRKIRIPYPCSEADYARVMERFVEEARAEGIECMAFGDLFLADIRRYREEKLRPSGIEPVFPVWGRSSDELAGDLIREGFRMVMTCVDPRYLPESFVGREFDDQLLRDLPPGVDPCGENGEFHTFVYAGPVFRKTIPVRVGRIVKREGFVYADVIAPGKPT